MLNDEQLNQFVDLQKKLRYNFNEPLLLKQALTHKSYAHETDSALENNERFEFLGDSVLDLIVSVYIVKTYAKYNEGTLSKIRAAIVNEQCLANLARSSDLGNCLLLGKGEELSGGREKTSLLANAFESVVGAVLFDSNFETAKQVFLPLLLPYIQGFSKTSKFRDYKSELQEYTQHKMNCIPSYKVIKESGPDHQKVFYVCVLVKKNHKGVGSGKSKKEAEQAAARAALEILSGV